MPTNESVFFNSLLLFSLVMPNIIFQKNKRDTNNNKVRNEYLKILNPLGLKSQSVRYSDKISNPKNKIT